MKLRNTKKVRKYEYIIVVGLSVFWMSAGSIVAAESAPIGKELQTLEFLQKTRQEQMGAAFKSPVSLPDLLAGWFDRQWRRLREQDLDTLADTKILKWSGVLFRAAAKNLREQLKTLPDRLRILQKPFIKPPSTLPVDEI